VISEELMLALQRIERVNDHVFTNLEGLPMKKYIIARELKRFQRHVGYTTNWGLRDLRASHGFNFLKRGARSKIYKRSWDTSGPIRLWIFTVAIRNSFQFYCVLRPFKDQGKFHYHNSNFANFREFWKNRVAAAPAGLFSADLDQDERNLECLVKSAFNTERPDE